MFSCEQHYNIATQCCKIDWACLLCAQLDAIWHCLSRLKSKGCILRVWSIWIIQLGFLTVCTARCHFVYVPFDTAYIARIGMMWWCLLFSTHILLVGACLANLQTSKRLSHHYVHIRRTEELLLLHQYIQIRWKRRYEVSRSYDI